MSDVPLASLSDFDFWIGEWDLSWSDGAHEVHGRNVISKVLSERVILEDFDGRPGADLRGMSVSTISAETGLWQRSIDVGAPWETVWAVSYRRAAGA